MREALNSNPVVQAVVLGVLAVGAAIFFLMPHGGGKEGSASGEATTTVEAGTASTPATGSTESAEGAVAGALEGAAPASVSSVLAGAGAPALPKPVLDAYHADRTIVLLIVHDGGIDDRLVRKATEALGGFRDAAVFVVPASRISRYAAITEGAGVDRVPALVVVRPKSLDDGTPTASVSYGFQSPESIAQAVIDAGYKGPTLDYHP